MARRRTHASAPRNRTVTIRLTQDEYLRRSIDARKAGMSVSGLCERLVCEGKVEAAIGGYSPMDPALFAEIRRLGNNANQIAHALNSNLPAAVQFAWQTANELLSCLGREELAARHHAEALRTRSAANDSPPAQARHVFQRSVQLHSPRRGSEDE